MQAMVGSYRSADLGRDRLILGLWLALNPGFGPEKSVLASSETAPSSLLFLLNAC